jgi:hypothetical protein
MSLESDGGMILTGENRRAQTETHPSATLSTTNPAWTDPGTNPGLRGSRVHTEALMTHKAFKSIGLLHQETTDLCTVR